MTEDDDNWHPLEDASTPAPARDIPPAVRMLEGKWKAEARRLDPGMGIGWAFVRNGRKGVSFMEYISTDKTWATLAMEGITVRPEVWKAARSLCVISGLPLMVVVDAADDVRFAKVTDFGPGHIEAQRLMVPAFRQA